MRARTARRAAPSAGQDARHRRAARSTSSAADGARSEPSLGLRAGTDDLREPLDVVLDEPDRAVEHGRGTAVVRLEVDARQAGQGFVGEAQEAANVGEAPAVDRLVVVADEEDPVVGRREQERQPELRPIEVLRLVDEQMPAARAPCREHCGVPPRAGGATERRGRRSRGRRAGESPPRTRRTLARRARPPGRPRSRAGSTSRSSLKRERIVSKRRRSAAVASGADGLDDLVAVEQRLDRLPGGPEHLEPERVEGPDADAPREILAQRIERHLDALPQLLRGALVERDGADRLGRRAFVDQPGDPRDQRRRLAGARRRDAQDRAGRRRRGAALVDLELGEPFGNGRVLGHGGSVANFARRQPRQRHWCRGEIAPRYVQLGVNGWGKGRYLGDP